MGRVSKWFGLVVATAIMVSVTELLGLSQSFQNLHALEIAQTKGTSVRNEIRLEIDRVEQAPIVTQPMGLEPLVSELLILNSPQGKSQAIAQADERKVEADRLFELGLQQYGRSQLREAIVSWEQALELYREIGDRAREGSTLGNLGVAHNNLGQYERAIDFLEQVLAIVHESGDRAGEGRALGNLGIAYASLNQYEQAIDSFEQHLAIARESGDRAGEGSALNNLGIIYRNLGQYERAIDFYAQALALVREVGDRAGEGSALNNLGNAYGDLGQYERAIDFYAQALGIDREIGDQAGEGSTLNNLGTAYTDLGQYERAIDFYGQALAIAREIGNQAEEGNVLGNLGITYTNLGQYGRAIDFYGQALAIAREIGNRTGEGNALSNLGIAHRNLGQPERAIGFYEQALAIAREIGNRAGESSALSNLGIAYNNLGQSERAIDFHQQALAIAHEIGDRAGEGDVLGNLGIAYDNLGQSERAIDLYEQALAIVREVGNRAGEGSVLNNLGTALSQTNRFAEAEVTLWQAIEVLESLRTNLTDAQLISIADTQASAYANLEQFLIAQDKSTEALAITERGRAQAFALQLALRQNNATEAPVTYPSVADIQHIAHEQNTTLVSYSLISDKALYIWVISPSGDIEFRSFAFDGTHHSINPIATIDGPVYRSDTPPSEVDQLVADTRAGIGVVSGIPAERLKELHEVLIDPITDLLPTDPNANVVFIPQGSLFLVPFVALQDDDGTYLIEKHTITTAPSIQVLGLAAEREEAIGLGGARSLASGATGNALVVGNPVMPVPANGDSPPFQLAPLPGAEVEAVEIGTLLNIDPLLGNQATETQIKQHMPTAPLIHLATHGLLNYRDSPFDIPGALALAPGNGEDGFLTASEILEMDLQAQLAILSACDTGRGEITGDGVVGLSRSLVAAGVPSVIVSLWAVPDAPTADLMTEFYRQLSEGKTKAQALRQAMLMTMAQHPEPINWAAFTLIGATD